jgi:hypothetical protein
MSGEHQPTIPSLRIYRPVLNVQREGVEKVEHELAASTDYSLAEVERTLRPQKRLQSQLISEEEFAAFHFAIGEELDQPKVQVLHWHLVGLLRAHLPRHRIVDLKPIRIRDTGFEKAELTIGNIDDPEWRQERVITKPALESIYPEKLDRVNSLPWDRDHLVMSLLLARAQNERAVRLLKPLAKAVSREVEIFPRDLLLGPVTAIETSVSRAQVERQFVLAERS